MQNENPVVIRDMRPGEEKALLEAARRAFVHSPMEQLGISKPKQALVAEVDGAIAGAMFLKVFGKGEKKTGYLDVGFVTKEHRGLGIGRTLYPAATNRLREMGCEHVCAMVIDDNVASWKSLKNQGFSEPTLTQLVRTLGLGPAVLLWLQTLHCMAGGARFWMTGAGRERGSVQELVSYIFVNLVLFLPGLLLLAGQPSQFVNRLLAFLCVLLAGVAFGGLGSLLAGGAWRFSFPRGGLLLSLVLNSFGTVFPMVGRWYPKEMQPTKECRRALGIQAAVEWVGLLAIFAVRAFLLGENGFVYQCAAIAAILLVYRLIPFMPFGSFGGGRVWGWNKFIFVAFAAVTLALLVLVIF